MFYLHIKYILIIFYLFTKSEARICLNITTSKLLNETRIKFKGEDLKLVTDKEILLFNVTQVNLKKGVRKELGAFPNDVFLRDPTPYYDLYKKYKWNEVKRKLTIKNTSVLAFNKEKQILKSHVFINNSTETVKIRVDLKDTAQNFVSFIWPRKGLPEDDVFINYTIDFGNGNLTFVDRWRSKKFHHVKLPMNTSKVVIENDSGTVIYSKLIATKITLLIEVEFRAVLVGNIIANYANLYGKYHFYSPTIQNIMKAGNIKNEVATKALLEVIYFTDPRLEVINKTSEENVNIDAKRRWKPKFKNTIIKQTKPVTKEKNPVIVQQNINCTVNNTLSSMFTNIKRPRRLARTLLEWLI